MTAPSALSKTSVFVFVLLALISTSAKVLLAGAGHNFDLESWALFSELVRAGENVYAETYRNPYGPIWAYVCAAADWAQARLLGSSSLEDFHRVLAFLLALVDVGIAWILFRRYSLRVGALFLANPVSLLVSGFHTQFGNAAVLLALAACLLAGSDREVPPLRFGLAMTVLGTSLVLKHILIFFPLWLSLRPGASRLVRALSLLPFVIFGASFLPFVGEERGLEGVIEHVLMYESFHLDGFFPQLVSVFVPLKAVELAFSRVPLFSGLKFLWLAAMLSIGFAVRTKRPEEQILIYLAAMVTLSTAVADQYLAIPLATCAVYWRHFTAWWYVATSAVYLTSSSANVGMLPPLADYATWVRGLGLERWHPVAALLIFLLLYLGGNSRSLRDRRYLVPRAEAARAST